ncbi:protein kinase [Candidatus Chloroploca sp. M-50]|uniref:Protein kinase n=1 Tax=Candidatus Chloroploca mongolica TaxID=2528176 RepID=A0ABS4D4R7_9CHLR|nr:protein kinase [Candidatus Chloroploca mongolica]MBP1464431.1 protein kinase [Candidatus Chloroploca mongolica]
MMFQPGQILDRRYRIEEFLGGGGFAYVYRAFDQVHQRQVALKTNRPESKEQRQALFEEFKQLRNLGIERIPQMEDLIEVDQQICLVLELYPR